MAILTGLSGNELYCLKEKGYDPGDLVIGNSVFALGFAGGVASGFKTLAGGEIHATPLGGMDSGCGKSARVDAAFL